MNKYFSRDEFACKCGCGFDTVDALLLEVLTNIRIHFNKPVLITSGCRCDAHNIRVGGSSKSQHKLGRAADIIVLGVSPQDVYDYSVKTYPNTLGLGNYDTFTHVDSRNIKARF